jgi:hypothetical protein
LKKKQKAFNKKKQRIISASLNSFDKLDILEELEQKEYKKKTRQESQLLVSTSKISVPINTP